MKLMVIKDKIKDIMRIFKFSMNVDKKAFWVKTFSNLSKIPIPLAQAYIAKLIMDQVSLGIQSSTYDKNKLFILVFLEFVMFFINSLINFWQEKSDFTYKHKLSTMYQNFINSKIEKIDFSYIESSDAQNKLYEVKNRSYNVESLLNSLLNFIRGASVLLSFIGFLFTISKTIAIILFVITIVSFVFDYYFSQKNNEFFKKTRNDRRLASNLSWMLVNPKELKELKTLNIENKLVNFYNKINNEMFKIELANKLKTQTVNLLLDNISRVVYFGSKAWIVWLTINRQITLGDFTMFFMIFSQTESGLKDIFKSLISVLEENEKIKTFFEFSNLPEINTVDLSPELFNRVKDYPIIELNNISFNYPSGKKVLKNINLIIEPFSKIALVGENGCGKSTLIKLICGLYYPTEGTITIGGINIQDFSRKQLKELTGVVFQDFLTLPLNFKDNIVYSEDDYSNDEYEEALINSNAKEVKEDLPLGDNQLLNNWLYENGISLSGGQWQKIAIARAFIQKSKIIILDEPTSAIDAKNEFEIFEKFQNLTKNKTSILVSHRFSTVRIAKRILFLENGHIIEDGNHNELLKLNGKYAFMFNLQAEGYK